MKSSAFRNALAAEELPANTSMEEYRLHMMRQVLVEPCEVEIHAIRVGFFSGLGEQGVALLRKYSVTCDDLIDMVRACGVQSGLCCLCTCRCKYGFMVGCVLQSSWVAVRTP